jgi:uncharacterized repeat protein (TIGR01451 family)
MRQLSLFVLLTIITSFSKLSAQTYAQGDMSVMPMFSAFHDSTECASMAIENYQVIINNSFLNDSFFVKDQNNGQIMFSAVNLNGANPWIFTAQGNSIIGYVPDDQVVNGMVFFPSFTSLKFISGGDTINNINSTFLLPVPNPCEYGNVSGRVYIDNNNDCIYNGTDNALQSIFVNSNANLSSQSTYYSTNGYTNTAGQYSAKVQKSWMVNYTVSIPTNYQFIFPNTTCSPASYNFTTLPQTTADFSLQCTSNVDVQSAASHPANARPLVPMMINPYVSNTGCNTASGTMYLVKDPHVVYNSTLSSNPPTSISGDTLTWQYFNLTNLTNNAYWNSFFAGVHLTPDNTVNIGDTLCFLVKSTILSTDLNPSNNEYTFCLPVVNSYDPNIKEVTPKGEGINGNIPQTTNKLNYTIHFQNTGNAPAYNVSIIDTLEGDIDAKSLQIMGASHTMSPEWLAPNVVKFNFYGIMLPDSNTSVENSQGSVSFSVKLKSALPLGTQIKNKGYIYFDFNPPIITNETINTLYQPNGINEINANESFFIYPNPANDLLTIEMPHFNNIETNMSVYSLNSQVVKTMTIRNKKSTLNVKDLAPGLYFIQLNNGSNSYKMKFVKE